MPLVDQATEAQVAQIKQVTLENTCLEAQLAALETKYTAAESTVMQLQTEKDDVILQLANANSRSGKMLKEYLDRSAKDAREIASARIAEAQANAILKSKDIELDTLRQMLLELQVRNAQANVTSGLDSDQDDQTEAGEA